MAFEISFVRERAASGDPLVWRVRVLRGDNQPEIYLAKYIQINVPCDCVFDVAGNPPGRIVCEGELVIVRGMAQITAKKAVPK